MADFGTLKTALRGLINRRDFTDQLAGDFINRAIDELQRVIRLSPMETLTVIDTWDGVQNLIAIPDNYLELVDLFTETHSLRNVSKDTYFNQCLTGPPRVYTKIGPNWAIKPTPPAGEPIYVQYYAETPWLTVDTDVNIWTKAAFNAALYGAAALAADYFQMEDQYVQRFQGKADQLAETLIAQDSSDRWSGQLTVERVHGHY